MYFFNPKVVPVVFGLLPILWKKTYISNNEFIPCYHAYTSLKIMYLKGEMMPNSSQTKLNVYGLERVWWNYESLGIENICDFKKSPHSAFDLSCTVILYFFLDWTWIVQDSFSWTRYSNRCCGGLVWITGEEIKQNRKAAISRRSRNAEKASTSQYSEVL